MPSPRDKPAQALEKNGINAAFSSAQAATLQARLVDPSILRLPRNDRAAAEPERLTFKQIRSRPGKPHTNCITRLRDLQIFARWPAVLDRRLLKPIPRTRRTLLSPLPPSETRVIKHKGRDPRKEHIEELAARFDARGPDQEPPF